MDIRDILKQRLVIVILTLLLAPGTMFAQHQGVKNALAVQSPAPFFPIPNTAQLRWHKAEYLMFVHFGMKTFYPSEDHMGYGMEDPQRFLPARFDARQWTAAAKAGGFNGIVLTSKHHDGFCNWQTQTTSHSVKASPWKNGKGDVVKEVADACRKANMQFGLYVSIIDKYFERNGATGYETYGDYYYAQVKELSTRYGKIDEYWFDGFNADKLKMDYPKIGRMIAAAQPEAVVYDSRVLVNTLPDRCLSWPGAHGAIQPDQNYRQLIGDTLRWYPNEPSIILQGNWFHNGKPAVGLRQMQDYYLGSVGYGVTALMNVSPNSDGLMDEATVDTLKELKHWVDQLHQQNPALFKKAQSLSGCRGNSAKYAASKVNDNNYDSYFASDDSVTTATIDIELGKPTKIDGFILQEYILLGQRVEDYSIECRVDGEWKPVFAGKKIGYKRIILAGRVSAKDVKFPVSDAVRLRINRAGASPLINNFQVISL
ncbi:alpha-L-fucosidase [Chitinophagaceae bacterium LB-8]|uniref:alpha-L-fucosidase n=1 Tax=Paraflavisolibacter caeni TaxID=2982496 RepID=A0A9X2Y142_9BACT|nr:alpha-L-fucosidase [Paraflavisolibacter caeni]MCU7552542.1 alpha-L-fucosidase [Paraflavisolibacter caeni]